MSLPIDGSTQTSGITAVEDAPYKNIAALEECAHYGGGSFPIDPLAGRPAGEEKCLERGRTTRRTAQNIFP